jgi:5-methylcytosine-specific restriction endonuclease McrA
MSNAHTKTWPNGSTRAWRKVRAHVLERDGYRCRLRFAGCTTIATNAHHIQDRTIYGDDPTHIIAACGPCNKKAGSGGAHTTTYGPDPAPTPLTQW